MNDTNPNMTIQTRLKTIRNYGDGRIGRALDIGIELVSVWTLVASFLIGVFFTSALLTPITGGPGLLVIGVLSVFAFAGYFEDEKLLILAGDAALMASVVGAGSQAWSQDWSLVGIFLMVGAVLFGLFHAVDYLLKKTESTEVTT